MAGPFLLGWLARGFYGEDYYWSLDGKSDPDYACEFWWDQPTEQWYPLYDCWFVSSNVAPTASFTFSCSGLSCSFDGGGSTDSHGTIEDYSWLFGDGTVVSGTGTTAEHTYAQPGPYTVTLWVTDDRGASGADTKAVTLELPNAAPSADFTFRCSGLSCSFDGGGSSDSDGTITSYNWTFGDGAGGSLKTSQHAYERAGSYTVTLKVTDNDGATDTDSETVTPISLSARGYKVKGLEKVDLAWSGSGGASFDVYRNGGKIAAVQGSAYTDSLNTRSSGTYVYKVCAAASPTCSNEVTVGF